MTSSAPRAAGEPVRVKLVGRVPLDMIPRVWQRQLPGGGPDYRDCRFLFDLDERDYDWLVVYDDLPANAGERFSTRTETLACPRERTILLTMEPSTIKLYGSAYLSQFGIVISSQEPWIVRHRGHLQSQAGLRWYYGLGSRDMLSYDDMAAHPPLEKSRVISTVCSSKRQRHTLHNLRWSFTQALAEKIPELDVFGHGVRAMDDKAEALAPYRYHVAVENFVGPHHWTEKLSDSFLACTLPFYFGAPDAADYVPPESFIPIDIRDVEGTAAVIREAIATNQWEKRLPAIMEARRLMMEEHNMFALVARYIHRLNDVPVSQPGGVLRSRRAARHARPLASRARPRHHGDAQGGGDFQAGANRTRAVSRAPPPDHLGSGRLTRMCRSRSCWFAGFARRSHQKIDRLLVHREDRDFAQVLRAAQQHHDTVHARRHAAMGRRAILERAIHAAETLDHRVLAIARDLEGLDHRLRAMIANAARRDLETVAGDVVLERLDGQRDPDWSAHRGRPAASRTDCGRSRPSSRPRSTRTSGNRRSRRVRSGSRPRA